MFEPGTGPGVSSVDFIDGDMVSATVEVMFFVAKVLL